MCCDQLKLRFYFNKYKFLLIFFLCYASDGLYKSVYIRLRSTNDTQPGMLPGAASGP